jgi:hypothetical protein
MWLLRRGDGSWGRRYPASRGLGARCGQVRYPVGPPGRAGRGLHLTRGKVRKRGALCLKYLIGFYVMVLRQREAVAVISVRVVLNHRPSYSESFDLFQRPFHLVGRVICSLAVHSWPPPPHSWSLSRWPWLYLKMDWRADELHGAEYLRS